MAARTTAATERALARVASGQSAYSAARAEGIALSTIYRALRVPATADYAYSMGEAFAAICAEHGDSITATAMGNVAARPDLVRALLRHIDLSQFDLPTVPDGWQANAAATSRFWAGYYHDRPAQ